MLQRLEVVLDEINASMQTDSQGTSVISGMEVLQSCLASLQLNLGTGLLRSDAKVIWECSCR